LISCFAHNEEEKSREIAGLLKEGKTIALVSDAGTPGVSDPGSRLVRHVIKEGLTLTVIPGPSATIAALAASGMDADMFAFGGFFPRRSKEKKAWIDRFNDFPGSLVFFESPIRIPATMRLLCEIWGDRKCCLSRELTKYYEEFIRGSVTEVAGLLEAAESIKGEIVVVIEGNLNRSGAAEMSRGMTPELMDELMEILLESGMRKKEASQKLARFSGIPAKECYAMMIKKP
jgi:16S rRNA (cytidine1402-2'-O)-methyltransferase